MNLNGQEYYYIRNAQNDIIALNNSRGTTVATYTYDSWGKLLSIKDENGTDVTNNKEHVGYKNPYRYRGYRYDTETGLYYLNSRYYNSEWGRFVSSDEIVGETGTLLSCNMFAYCSNDPINNEDPDGDIAWWIGAAIGGAAFDTAMYLFQHRNGGFTWRGLGKAAATGAITGVLFAGAGKVIAKGVNAVLSARRARKAARAFSGGACFTEETLILAEEGYKQIKDVKVGDKVYSQNPETGEKGLKKVKNIFVHETNKIVHLYIDGKEIKTTETHPFWVIGEGWVEAGNLKVGDKVFLYSGKVTEVSRINVEILNKPVKVYNFEVEDWHTYFVLDRNVLVHNSCMASPKSLMKGKPNTHVYYGIKNGKRVYVGIAKDVAKRARQHGARFSRLRRLTKKPLYRRQARAIEQVLIERNPHFVNKINSISRRRSWYSDAIEWGEQWLEYNAR